MIYVKVTESIYRSNQKRNLLIGAIAGAYEAATNPEQNFWAVDSAKFCYAPQMVAAFTEGLISSYIPLDPQY